MTIVNDDSMVVNKLKTSLTDDARVIIYDRHMLIVQAISVTCIYECRHPCPFMDWGPLSQHGTHAWKTRALGTENG